MKKTLSILALALSLTSFAQTTNIWTDTLTTCRVGHGIMLDDTSCYVVGSYITSQYYTYMTLAKLNNNGDTIWTNTYPYEYGKPNGYGDYNEIIVKDKDGNIYVGGTFIISNTDDDYSLIKYNSSGDTLWTRNFNGSENKWDILKAIAMDSVGNIIVTGAAHVGGTNGDCHTIKYDQDGNKLWEKSFDSGNSSYDDYGQRIVIDQNNNIYIGGDFGFIKYDEAGTELWSKVNSTFSQSGAEGVNILIDDDLNVIYSTRFLNNQISKYTQFGSLLYTTNFEPTSSSDQRLQTTILDSDDNIIITGAVSDGGWNAYTIKLDHFLDTIWTTSYNGDYPIRIYNDTLNNIYILTQNSTLLKYDTNGILLWDTLLPSLAENLVFSPNYYDFYTTGSSLLVNPNDRRMVTEKYSLPKPPVVIIDTTINPLNVRDAIRQTSRELVRIVDVLGREVAPTPNAVLFYIYSDGSTEKILQIK